MSASSSDFDLHSSLIAYECGDIDGDRMIELFQHLVDTGLAWKLQGHYGRNALALIEAGLISESEGDDDGE